MGGSMKKHIERGLAPPLIVTALLLASCSAHTDVGAAGGTEPATIEHVEGTGVSRITLTALAAERLGIETAKVETTRIGGAGGSTGTSAKSSIPFSAVIYDANGRGWTYTNPEPLVFMRERIVVDREVGKVAFLNDGPPPGTTVVTVGAQELWGTEYEVGE
jgi:hypothetical protein